ncbi:MAG: hypothetical protein ACOYON_13255 [Fimbriimonas sp.]
MRRWVPAFLLVLLLCIPVFFSRASDPGLLRDSDTKVLLATIRERQAPLSWFSGDWPLMNHFYRPISTLAFEADNAVYGDNAAGYGTTNALLCVGCILLLFWFLRELTDQPLMAGAATSLFAIWHLAGMPQILSLIASYAALGALIGGVLRHRLAIRQYVPAFLVWTLLQGELNGITSLPYRMIGWIPGRTASVMTVFALIAMAAYARYERTGARRLAGPALGPLDPPATRSTEVAAEPGRFAWIWATVAILATMLALGSYEQAVMLPAALLGVAVCLRLQRVQVRWGWQVAFWGVLVAYIALRYQVIPRGNSGYQSQQLRYGPGVVLDLLAYALPAGGYVQGFLAACESGWLMLITATPYQFAITLGSNLVVFFRGAKRWVWLLTGWALSFLTFLPMAWLKTFDHYHYWPMAMRSVFVVALVYVAVELTINAWSPQAQQAPPRPAPAPGSLPHR